jgi:hypothetical protein
MRIKQDEITETHNQSITEEQPQTKPKPNRKKKTEEIIEKNL